MIPWLNTHTLAYLAWGLVNTGLFVQLGQQAQWGITTRIASSRRGRADTLARLKWKPCRITVFLP
jgi:hypothetical protein